LDENKRWIARISIVGIVRYRFGKMIKEVRNMTVVNNDNKNPFLDKNDSGIVILDDYLIQGLMALDFMRLNGVIHSDIKPANLFIRSENDKEVLKIGDFGMAKVGFGSQLKATSLAGYSPAYQPPEARSDPNFKPGPISDIYSFGVSMWEIATLDNPDPAIQIELPTGYASADVVTAINAMLSGNPSDRPSAESLLRRFPVCFITPKIYLPSNHRCSVYLVKSNIAIGRGLESTGSPVDRSASPGCLSRPSARL